MSELEQRATIIQELAVAYWMEMETVMNFISNSINLDGVRAEEIKASLLADVQAELTHAQLLAKRIKTLGGTVPGSMAFSAHEWRPLGNQLRAVSPRPAHIPAVP